MTREYLDQTRPEQDLVRAREHLDQTKTLVKTREHPDQMPPCPRPDPSRCCGDQDQPPLPVSSCFSGTSVIQVTATDADDSMYGNSAKLVYSISQGHPYFSVDPNSGTWGQVTLPPPGPDAGRVMRGRGVECVVGKAQRISTWRRVSPHLT